MPSALEFSVTQLTGVRVNFKRITGSYKFVLTRLLVVLCESLKKRKFWNVRPDLVFDVFEEQTQ
jgi:hypothetical protein